MAASDAWTFVWVGANAQQLTIVEGIATSKSEDSGMRFEIVGKDSAKYILDATVEKTGAVEAGFAGVGSAYVGVTFLKGHYTRGLAKDGAACGIEMLQVQNAFNSISLKRQGSQPKC